MNEFEAVDRIMTVMLSAFPPDFGEAWSRRQVEDALLLGHTHYLLADDRGENPARHSPCAGFSLSRHGYEEEELLLFAVSPEYRGRGVGTRLLDRFAECAKARGAKRLLLEMRRGNTAESVYRRMGFEPIGVRPNYYRAPLGARVDAITFALDLD